MPSFKQEDFDVLNLATVDRLHYEPSGKVIWSRFVLGSLAAILTACIGGLVLSLLYGLALRIYPLLPIAVLFFAGIGMSWILAKSIDWSHCRNPKVGMALGALCGLLMFVSAVHTTNALARCRAGATLSEEMMRFDLLPDSIMNRFRHIRWLPSGQPELTTELSPLRSLFTLLEIAFLVWLPLIAGRDTSQRAYSENCGRWFQRTTVRALPSAGDQIVATLKANQDLSEILFHIPLSPLDPRPEEPKFLQFKMRSKEHSAHALMQLESLFDEGSEIAYLTVIDVGDKGKKQWLFRQLQLIPAELGAAKHLFVGSN